MSTLKLAIGNKNYSSWSLRPWMLLRHLGLAFEEVLLQLDTPQFKSQVAAWSPAARVPVLRDGDLAIWDSLAICEYASELAAGRGWPREPAARARARSLACEMHSGFQALRSQWGSATRDTSWTAATPPTSSDLPLAGAAVVAAGPGLRTTVTIAAPTTQVVGTLVYSGSGGPDEAVLAGDGGRLADGDLGGGGTELLVPGTRVGGRRVDVTVPAGAQQEIALDGLDGAAVAWATWQAAEGSGPASVGHLSIDASAPLASGFPWWPTTSAVRTVPVTADVGTLLGTGP